MLRPNKHSDPDKTTIFLSAIIIKYMESKKVSSYSDLFKHCTGREPGSNQLFIPALNLVFLLGKIEYIPKNDLIEYRKK